MTVGTVPSEMSTPVGFAGAGTSPALADFAPSPPVSFPRTAWTTRAGGMRHPRPPSDKSATTKMQNE